MEKTLMSDQQVIVDQATTKNYFERSENINLRFNIRPAIILNSELHDSISNKQ